MMNPKQIVIVGGGFGGVKAAQRQANIADVFACKFLEMIQQYTA